MIHFGDLSARSCETLRSLALAFGRAWRSAASSGRCWRRTSRREVCWEGGGPFFVLLLQVFSVGGVFCTILEDPVVSPDVGVRRNDRPEARSVL